jgi:hypothetical protein
MALECAFDVGVDTFWNFDMHDLVSQHFPECRGYSEGRCDGWLVVHGLTPVAQWDAILLSRWIVFERDVKRTISWLTSKEFIRDYLKVNNWQFVQEAVLREASK